MVRTRKVGHFFPGGTVDAFDVWVELEAQDDKGRPIFHSGQVADGGKGPVEPGAHFYRSLLLDEHGNPINKRNAWMARSVAYVRLIPPGAADTVHYRLRVPDGLRRHDRRSRPRSTIASSRGGTRSGPSRACATPSHTGYSLTSAHDDGRWVFTGDTSGSPARSRPSPTSPSRSWRRARPRFGCCPAAPPLAEDEPFLDRPCASAGTTTESACSCRAT